MYIIWLSTVASTRVQGWGGRTTEWGGVWGGEHPSPHWLEAERTEIKQYWSAIYEST